MPVKNYTVEVIGIFFNDNYFKMHNNILIKENLFLILFILAAFNFVSFLVWNMEKINISYINYSILNEKEIIITKSFTSIINDLTEETKFKKIFKKMKKNINQNAKRSSKNVSSSLSSLDSSSTMFFNSHSNYNLENVLIINRII